jgi:CheY-like chemotaxis protein
LRIFRASDPQAPIGWLDVLATWLRSGSRHTCRSAEVAPHNDGRPLVHAFGPVHVLVVDDNPANRMVISALLAARGLVPSIAEDGAQAVALASGQQFDLILMDLQMPILDGLDATSAIRHVERSFARSAVPVVANTSRVPGAGLLAMHGLNGSLIKPCEDQDLEDCLVRWCPAYRSAPPMPALAQGIRN